MPVDFTLLSNVPPSKLCEVALSKFPLAESNCSVESNVKKKLVPSSVVLTTFVLSPEKSGFCVEVVTSLKLPIFAISVAITVSLLLKQKLKV